MLATIVDKINKKKKISTSTSDPNPDTTTLNAAAVRENLNYIENFGLPPSVAQHIDTRLIFHDVHIDDPTTASDIELNSWVLNCLESYQLRPTLVIHRMLDVFRDEFYGWGYTEFSKMDRHIRDALKETFMAKGIYMGTPNGHVNQRLANLVIDEQLPTWDKNDLLHYKSMFSTSKAWLLLELRHFHLPQQHISSIKSKIDPINDRRQQSFTPGPTNVTPNPANALDSTPLTEALLVQITLVQASPTPEHPIQIPAAQVLPIQVSLAQVLSIPVATIQAPPSIPLALSPPAEHGHKQPEMHPEQVKILSDEIDTFTNKHADAGLSASGQKEIQGLLETDDFKVVISDKVVTPEEIPSNTQVFNSSLVDNIKDLCTNKVVHAYNDKKKNLVLMHSPKIPGFSQGIGSCLPAIIRDDDNNNIKFYLRDITQAYIEIASDLNLNFYIQPLSKLISQPSASSNSIAKVMRPLYGKPEADNHRFGIYHPHYKEKPGMTESAHNPFLCQPPLKDGSAAKITQPTQ